MTSAGSSGGLPPSNIPKTTQPTESSSAQNAQQNQASENTPQPRKAAGPKSADKNTPIMSNSAASASYAQVASQIKSTNVQEAAKAAAGTQITLSDGSKLELDFSKINSSTLSGLQSAEFDDVDFDDDDGTDLTQRDKDLLAAAFGMFNAV